MNKADKLFFIFLIILIVAAILRLSFSMGKKSQCEKDINFIYSYDYDKCVRIGVENYK